MMPCITKKHPYEPIHLFITRGANIGKTFTLMVLVQALTCFYNIHFSIKSFKKERFVNYGIY